MITFTNIPAIPKHLGVLVLALFILALSTEKTFAQYCAPGLGVGCSPSYGTILNVTFNTINNTSAGTTAYENFTAQNTSVIIGNIYNVSVKATAEVTGGGCNMWASSCITVYIDWNADFDFLDANETTILTAGFTGTNQIFTANITAPAGTISGGRMRVVLNKATFCSNPCVPSGTGQVEDYTITSCPLPTVLSSSQTICSGNTAALSASAGYTTIQWQTSPDGVIFTDIGGATSSTYTTPALTSTTYYRATTTPTCMGNSNIVTVTVSSTPIITAQPSSQSTCLGSGANFSLVASGTPTYQWQVSTNSGSTWANVSNGGTFPTYAGCTTTTLGLTGTIAGNNGYMYRCNATACSSTITSDAVTLTIATAVTQSYAWTDQSVSASTATLAGNTPATGLGVGTWTCISGCAGVTITTPSSPTSGVTGLVAGTATTFRWTIAQAGCTSSFDDVIITRVCVPVAGVGCNASYGNISNVTYNTINNTSAGTTAYENFTAQNTTLTIGSINQVSVTATAEVGAGGCGMWQSTCITVFIDWNGDGDFVDANEATILTTGFTGSNQVFTTNITVPAGAIGNGIMRVVLNANGGCSDPCVPTGTGQVEDYTVIVCPTPTVLSPTSPSVCSGSTLILTASVGFANIQWQSSTDSITFNNIGGATSSTYTTPALTSTMYYRATTTPACMGATNVVKATIIAAPTISSQPVGTALCTGFSTLFTVVANPVSSTYQWQYYNGATWNNVVTGTPTNFTYTNATTATLTVATTGSATPGSYQYRCNVTGCAVTVTSSAATLTLNGAPVSGSITPLSTAGTCASPASFTLTLAGGYTGTIQWQSSTDNSTWSNIYGATSANYSSTANVTTYYRTVQTTNSCINSQASTAAVTISGATTTTWLTTGSSVWTSGLNWSNGVPTSCTDVIILAGGTQPLVSLPAYCHDLTINSGSTLTIDFSASKFLNVYGDLVNNGTLASDDSSGSNPMGQCSPCSGLMLMGKNSTWEGTGTYPALTVAVGDGSNTFMRHDATINVLDATKTSAIGYLNLGTQTLRITHAFSQSQSEVHVNTGMLWLNISSSMLVDVTSLFPEYGTVFNDLQGLYNGSCWNWSSNSWANIGGTGFYNWWVRLSVCSTNSYSINGSQHCRNDFRIMAGAPILFGDAGNFNIQVKGDFINEATTFTHNSTNEVIMNGPAYVYDNQTNTYILSDTIQNITGPTYTAFTELTIDNLTNGVRLNGIGASVGNSTTTGVLTLTKGPLYLNSQTLTIINNNTSAVVRNGGTSVGYIVSENNVAVNPSILKWKINTTTGAHVVPFGTATGSYIPVTFNNSGDVDDISFSTHPTNNNNDNRAGLSNVAAVSSMYSTVISGDGAIPAVIDRWWDITSSLNPGGATAVPPVTLSLSYVGSENTMTPYNDVISIQHWNGGVWNAGTTTGTADGTYISTGSVGVNTGTQTVTGSGIVYFSPFILGRITAPLPIELYSFNADCNEDHIDVLWLTSSEINNAYFTIEKSIDAIDWAEIHRESGAGNSNVMQSYHYTDHNPAIGQSYYRLVQTDFNGTSQTFAPVSVNGCAGGSANTMLVYPNPATDMVTIIVNADQDYDNTSVTIHDMIGRNVYNKIVNLIKGENKFTIALDEYLPGNYSILVQSDALTLPVAKVIIQK